MAFVSRFGNMLVDDEPTYKSEKGVINGIASLDGTGKVPLSQLPASVVGAVKYKGTWDSLTNTPTLSNSGGGGVLGDYYVVNVSSSGVTTIDGISDWQIGDWIINNGTVWEKVDNTDVVTSVNSKVGSVTLGLADILGQSASSGAFDVSMDSGQGIAYNVGSGGRLISLSTTSPRTWNLPDDDGQIALTSQIGQAGHVIYQSPSGTPLTQRVKLVFAGATVTDVNDLTYGDHTLVTIPSLPANVVTGTGSTNFNTRWTSASTIGDGIIQDNGVSASIGLAPVVTDKFSVVGISTTQSAIKGESTLNALINRGGFFVSGGGTIGSVALASLANASGAGGISVGGQFASISGCGTVVHPDAQPFTSFGFTASAGVNTGNANHVLGGFICAVATNADDNVGLFIKTANGGAGSSYAMLIEDGNEGAGKVLTSDANGFASWQIPAIVDSGETYTITNDNTLRTINANAINGNNFRDIFCTLLRDLATSGALTVV